MPGRQWNSNRELGIPVTVSEVRSSAWLKSTTDIKWIPALQNFIEFLDDEIARRRLTGTAELQFLDRERGEFHAALLRLKAKASGGGRPRW
jgi:hypothetical protein